MGKINKKDVAEPPGRVHKRNDLPDDLLRFSFRHLAANAKFGHAHAADKDAHLGQLLERLQSLSGMKLSEFRTNKDKALRAHTHRWTDTTEKEGSGEKNSDSIRSTSSFSAGVTLSVSQGSKRGTIDQSSSCSPAVAVHTCIARVRHFK